MQIPTCGTLCNSKDAIADIYVYYHVLCANTILLLA